LQTNKTAFQTFDLLFIPFYLISFSGMVMQLKKAVGEKYILTREHELMQKARQRLSKLENFHLLGSALSSNDYSHLPVLSFVISDGKNLGGFLHHNFVCALLNDVFGIQARGGKQCYKKVTEKCCDDDYNIS